MTRRHVNPVFAGDPRNALQQLSNALIQFTEMNVGARLISGVYDGQNVTDSNTVQYKGFMFKVTVELVSE